MSRNLFCYVALTWHPPQSFMACRGLLSAATKIQEFPPQLLMVQINFVLDPTICQMYDPVLLNDRFIMQKVRKLGTGLLCIEIKCTAICLKRLRKIMNCFGRKKKDLSQFRIDFFPRRITNYYNFAVQFHKNSLKTIFAVLSYKWIKHDLTKCAIFLSRSCGKYLKMSS